MKINSQKKYLICTILIMLVIFVHSAMPADLSGSESGFIESVILKFIHADPDRVSFVVRKCAHFLEYFILGISFAQSLRYTDGRGRYTCTGTLTFLDGLIAVCLGSVYALTDEIHQYFVPGRSCEIRDICIDAFGALCGCLIVTARIRK